MYKHLYDSFKHWYHGGSIYFYSDPHFADLETQKLTHDYISDDEQVKMINSKIGKNDTLVILGDIGDKTYLKKIRGYKVLILGNHDAGATTYKDFVDEIYEGALMISDKIILSHEPVNFDYCFNIHGHDHSGWHKSPMRLNVCAEHINHTPVSLKSIVESGILQRVPSIHREAIDKARKRSQKSDS